MSDGVRPMNLRLRKIGIILFLLCSFEFLSGCGTSQNEMEYLFDDAYEQGYWDALACVKRKGGSAWAAADDCKDE